MNTLALSVAGESVELFAARALHWPARRTLIVADLHWGKAATFRAAQIPIPRGTTAADLGRLDTLLAATAATRLLILGDLLHAELPAEAEATAATLLTWRATHRALDMVLVRGNHDARPGALLDDLGITVHEPPLAEGPFILTHQPAPSGGGYNLAGHVHPSVELRGPARERLRLPCFRFGPSAGLLPAFGGFTGMAPAEPPAPGERVYALAGDTIVPVPGPAAQA